MSNQRTWEFISKIKFGNNMDEMFQMTLLGILGVTAETDLRQLKPDRKLHFVALHDQKQIAKVAF
jgi:hypothetical protein